MAKDTKRVVDETIGAFKALKKEIQEYKDQLATLKVGTEEWNNAAEKLRNAQKQVDSINKAAKGTLVDYNNAQENSINALKEKIKLLNQERNAMDMNSKEYKEATAELKVLNDKLREAGTSAGDWRANVGNYTSSIREALGDLSTAAGGLTGSIGGLNAGMLKLATNPVGGTILALTTAIKGLAVGIKSSEENTNRWKVVMADLKAPLVLIEQKLQSVARKFLDWAEGVRETEKGHNILKGTLQVILTIINQTETRIKNLIEGVRGIVSSTKEGVGKLKEWAEGLKNTFQPVVDFVDKISGRVKEKLQPVIDWIIDKYNKLAKTDLGKVFGLQTIEQVNQSWEEAGEEAEELTDDLDKLAERLREIARLEAALASQRRKSGVALANLQTQLNWVMEEYQEALNNKDWDTAQKKLTEQMELQKKIAGEKVALASAELSLIQKKNSLSDSSSKDLDAEAAAAINLANAQGELATATRNTEKQQGRLNKAMEADNKEKKAEALKKAVADLNIELKAYESNYNNAIASINKAEKPEVFNPNTIKEYYDEQIINAQREYEAYAEMQDAKIAKLQEWIDAQRAAGVEEKDILTQIQQLEALRMEQMNGYPKQYRKMIDDENQSDKERAKAIKTFNKSQIKSYADLFDSVSGMFEQNSIAYKATATAKAIISTYLAANEALAAGGGAPWGLIPMAATITAGLAQVKAIWSTNAKGETSVPSSSSAVPSIAEPVMEQANPYSYTRQVQTFDEEDSLNRPIYVTVTDINEVQNRVRVTEEESTF